jgi:4,5-DOPA dioxygenase extradiol
MTERPGDMAAMLRHRDYAAAVPTPEHFLPVLYLAGMAAAANATTDVLVDGYTYGSLSMTAYTLDARCPRPVAGDLDGAASLQTRMPPEDANI